jgi:KAP family P-loop domain
VSSRSDDKASPTSSSIPAGGGGKTSSTLPSTPAAKRVATGSTSPVEASAKAGRPAPNAITEPAAPRAPSDVRQGSPHAEVDLDGDGVIDHALGSGEPARLGEPGASEGERAHDPELSVLLRCAAWIGKGESGEPYASFTSLFLAFLASHGPVAAWVQGKAEWIGPELEDIVRRWRIRAPSIRGLDAGRVKLASRLKEAELPTAYATSPSANQLLTRARALANELSDGGPLGARHLLAAFVYERENLRDLEAWQMDREAWATRALVFAIEAHPDRAEAWQTLHDRHYPRPPAANLLTALRWATWRAGEEVHCLDSTLLLEGILLEGQADEKRASSASQLVKEIGAGISALELDPPADVELPEEPLPMGAELQPILARARIFATATRPSRTGEERRSGTLDVRHVVAALLTDARPLGAFEVLRRAGRTEGGVLAQFRQWLCTIGPDNDDRELWRELFDEHRDDVLAGFDNDAAIGEDRLGIDRDVRGLAAVLASTKVTPPLSVGLFGDWGSGKSFFMAKLRERIDQLAAAAHARPDAESWFCGKRGAVVQIDFNAWHYMDADLWSSLAVRVFDALSEHLKEQFAQACLQNISAIKERETRLQEEKDTLEEKAKKLDELLQHQRDARAQREVRLAELMRKLADEQVRKIKENPEVARVTAKLRLEGANVKKELQRARSDAQYVGGRAELWWRTLNDPQRAITLVAVIVLPAVAAILIKEYVQRGDALANALGTYLATLVGLASWVRAFAKRVAGPIDNAISEVERIEQAVRDQKSPEELGLEAERDSRSARIAELEREQLALAQRKAELETELETLRKGNAQTLREFILERAAAQDYRKNLGVISAIHRDFTQLAQFLAPSGEGPNVERIVLYIDDLDRCPPKRVVEVLQAIHIILSLPLFVVVVAVDSRWLLDSLAAFYREQFPKDAVTLDVARPQQYLEKIFQVPYALTPMSDEGYGALVAAMLGSPATPPGRSEGHRASGHEASGGSGTSPSGTTVTGRIPTVTGRPRRPTGARLAIVGADGATQASEPIDLMPQSLRLEPEELEHLKTLARLVPTPRSAKRLVNLYRIVRASLEDDELTHLLGGGYRLLQICLGLVIGYPSFGAELFGQILSGRITSRRVLIGWLEERSKKSLDGTEGLDARDVAALGVLRQNDREFENWKMVERTVRRVGRFSFETGRTLALHAAVLRNAAAAAATAE